MFIEVHYGPRLNNFREGGICLQTLEDPCFPLPNFISFQIILDKGKGQAFGKFPLGMWSGRAQGKDVLEKRFLFFSFLIFLEKIFLYFLLFSSSRRGGRGDLGKLWIFLVYPSVFGAGSIRDGSLGPSYNGNVKNLCWAFFPLKWENHFNPKKPYKVLNPTELGPNKWKFRVFCCYLLWSFFNRSIFFISFWKSNFWSEREKK